MLTFFRRIRKGLLGSGATGKYILYAIGEILLVVVGILIALQINNWNQEIAIRKSERTILQGILTELNKNIVQLQRVIEDHRITEQTGREILHWYNGDMNEHDDDVTDSLIVVFPSFITFNPGLGYLKSVISSGKINHIQNQTIVSFITEFEDRVNDVNENSVHSFNLWLNQLKPIINRLRPHNSAQWIKESFSKSLIPISNSPFNFSDLHNNLEAESLVAAITGWISYAIDRETGLTQRMKSMSSIIQGELVNSKAR